MYLYRDLRIELDDDIDIIKTKLAKKLGILSSSILDFKIYKKSIDARNKDDIFFIYSLLFNYPKKINNKKISKIDYNDAYPIIKKEENIFKTRPIIIGFGPSSMFAGLYLAKKGLKPIIIEQGKCVDDRKKDVEDFFTTGKLNKTSNVCFGEGGAGTFSDGKLNTNNNDPTIRLILNEFYNHGAPEEILFEAKPHIGTDKLCEVVKNIRIDIESCGGEVFFETKFLDLIIQNNRVVGVNILKNGKVSSLYSDVIFLGIGHSCFDSFKSLQESNVSMSKKPFAMGLRIQHQQDFINKVQYGKYYKHSALPAASYKLITHLDNGRTVFSFCNCPGGTVVNAATEEDGIVCNGMSNFARNGKYSNCAILVNVKADDIESSNPLDSLIFQRNIEKTAFSRFFSNKLVVSSTKDFINDTFNANKNVEIESNVGYTCSSLNNILPNFIEESLKEGLKRFDNIMKGFVDNSFLFGVETRSSSPIKLNRTENFVSTSYDNLYVIGEGAGYAGGIMTSAIDGLNAAKTYYNLIRKESTK